MNNYQDIALRHAERIGVYEYEVNGKYMEYWSLYDKGFYFFRIDLDTFEREEVCLIPMTREEVLIPAFLRTPEGWTRYNYFEG